jgi:hypothetical protein
MHAELMHRQPQAGRLFDRGRDLIARDLERLVIRGFAWKQPGVVRSEGSRRYRVLGAPISIGA